MDGGDGLGVMDVVGLGWTGPVNGDDDGRERGGGGMSGVRVLELLADLVEVLVTIVGGYATCYYLPTFQGDEIALQAD
ncbi:uncharacterized protein LAJ45_04717 [Morchella importuna]|uniref:uncharacterized protein n=1 Tax=Morchella importuna TaxID=1174673 RepID=UPI001E8D4120|nr:uncharacterized protein LAJ45_04717 [Morchella importuna]KAH8151016.1 hypothetical protein LAJ45_04717 [Morchella importuna]